MLRSQFWQVTRGIASTSQSCLHTSATLRAQSRKHVAGAVRKSNILKQSQRAKEVLLNRPSVVLGTRPDEERAKWRDCNLAKILVNEEDLVSEQSLEPVDLPIGTLELPKSMAFGVSEMEKKMLFDDLPRLSAQAAVLAPSSQFPPAGSAVAKFLKSSIASAEEKEIAKANAFAKVLDLRNANAAGIAFENRRRIVLAFSSPENPFDPGRAEVQAALKTYQIRKLWNHLITNKRDVGNRLGLRKLVHQRAKILRYLKGVNRDRYETVLERLALEPESVEGELVV